MNPFLLSILTGTVSAVLVDLHSFVQSRKQDPTARFDWCLIGVRALAGAATGFLFATGSSAATNAAGGGN